ncbi:two-component system, OmpR family, sensor histidine kinase VanS [Sporanaerobacter acetigenes DSM 13106]|uniref:histidine kinase n=3 Tax=Sporanaerobacter acetigenes TaxID=165813 RepID=A0A1M5Z240_9FIRM|nr:two-component system, OmpR family, sensor histidine kinase VanS [Sporanaerobacter acetigenes DSM 13106]
MNDYYNYFKKKFQLKFVFWAILYTVIILLLFFVFKVILSRKTYFGYEFMYPFFHWANNNKAFLIFLVLTFGYAIIILRCFKKSLKYMDEIISAMEEVYKKDDEMIILSGDLKEVNDKMNKIKFKLRENEKIARDSENRKNDLIIYLAHDLKTPLTSIIGYLTILKEENDISERFRKKYLGIVYDKALRLEDLINEFFDITRYNLNDIVLEKSTVDFSFMMEQIIYEFKPLLREKNLSINSNIESGININIDTNKIERVVDNIIRNAINYSYADSKIDVCVNKNENFVNIVIANRGATIPSAKLDHIFDEFFRLDSSRSSETGNAGLGLAIAKSIVTAHGGTIAAKSQDDIIEMSVKLPI